MERNQESDIRSESVAVKNLRMRTLAIFVRVGKGKNSERNKENGGPAHDISKWSPRVKCFIKPFPLTLQFLEMFFNFQEIL